MCTLAHINATPDILYDQLASPSLLWYFVRQRDYDGFTWIHVNLDLLIVKYIIMLFARHQQKCMRMNVAATCN